MILTPISLRVPSVLAGKMVEFLNGHIAYTIKSTTMKPIIHEHYQHRYGGVYQVVCVATHTGSKERLVIYDHVYPFEDHSWARPIEEWTEERFRLLTGEEVITLLNRDRETFQLEISAAKNAAKGK